MKTSINMQSLSPVVLRVGLGLVMLWFGFSQVSEPSAWTSYLPTWTGNLPISEIGLVSLNGYFELAFGTLMILGIFTRIVAFFLALHLIGIMVAVGYNEIGVRDFGIAVGLISVFLHGKSRWSLGKV